MRTIVLILFILAIGKVWLKSEIYKESTNQALLAAYRMRAEIGCNDRPQTDPRGMPVSVGKLDWKKSINVEIIIGNPRINVPVWQINNPLWNTRFKTPYLKLSLREQQTTLYCFYDILNSSSEILIQ